MRAISFPAGNELKRHADAELFVRPASCTDNEEWQFFSHAQGEVEVPDSLDVELRLTPSSSPGRFIGANTEQRLALLQQWYLQALSTVAPDDLRSLYIYGLADSELIKRIGRLVGLRELEVWGMGVVIDESVIAHLTGLSDLRKLYLYAATTDDALTAISTMECLTLLHLRGTGIIGEGLNALKRLSLEELSLDGTRLSKAGWRHIGSLTSIRRLSWNWPCARRYARTDRIERGYKPDWNPDTADHQLAYLTSLPRLHSLSLQRAPVTDHGAKQLCSIASLTSLDLTGTEVTDAGVGYLARLPRLSHIALSVTPVTTRAVAELVSCGSLRSLRIDGTRVNDEAGPYLAQMRLLEELSVRPTDFYVDGAYSQRVYSGEAAVTDKGYECLRSMLSLRVIDLYGTTVTDRTLEYLQGHPNLRELLADHTALTGAGFGPLPEMRSLHMGHTQITDQALSTIASYNKLEDLHVGGSEVTDAGLAKIGALRNLRRLNISGTRVTDEGVRFVANMKSLVDLDIGDLALTGNSLAAVAELPHLRELHLSLEFFSLASLEELTRSASLRTVHVQQSREYADKAEALQEMLPRCQIVWL